MQRLYVLSIEEINFFVRDPVSGEMRQTMARHTENARKNLSARDHHKALIFGQGLQPQLRAAGLAVGGPLRGRADCGAPGSQVSELRGRWASTRRACVRRLVGSLTGLLRQALIAVRVRSEQAHDARGAAYSTSRIGGWPSRLSESGASYGILEGDTYKLLSGATLVESMYLAAREQPGNQQVRASLTQTAKIHSRALGLPAAGSGCGT